MRIATPDQIAYWRWLAGVTTADVERFNAKWTKVASPNYVGVSGPCHLWTAGTSKGGQDRGTEKLPYGSFWIAGTTVRSHIFAALVIGTFKDIPLLPGLHVDHRCRQTLCVAPRHLEPVPVEENANRWRK